MVQRGRPAPEFVAELHPAGTTQDALVAELRRVLASGRVRPGALLPLDGIARAFGVSRTPVREALKTLLGEGLIRHDHRGGYIVHSPTRAEFVELYAIRRALEGVALSHAVRLASAAQRADLRASLAQQREALDAGDIAGWDAAGRAFHEASVAPSAMPRLCTLIRDAANASGATRPMLRLSLEQVERLYADHLAIADGFDAGAVADTVRLAAEHLRRVRSLVLESFGAPA